MTSQWGELQAWALTAALDHWSPNLFTYAAIGILEKLIFKFITEALEYDLISHLFSVESRPSDETTLQVSVLLHQSLL